MPVVVADTSPLFYLLSISQIDILPHLFGKVFIPGAVFRELRHHGAPSLVQRWATVLPDWLAVVAVDPSNEEALHSLDVGEREAILLALSLRAGLILIDDR